MSSFPPPPKMSGMVTPSGASATSTHGNNRFSTPSATTTTSLSSSRYQTPPPPIPSSSTSTSTSMSGLKFKSTSYENYAPRSSEQRSKLARIAALTAGPCFAAAAEESKGHSTSSEQEGSAEEKEEEPITLALAMMAGGPKSCAGHGAFDIINSNSNFYSSSTGTSTSTSTEQTISQTLASTLHATTNLTTLIQTTSTLRLALHASINIANDVVQRHSDLLRHSGELSAAAERLQHEEAILTQRAHDIGMPLQHYDAVDRIGPMVGVAFKEGGRVLVMGQAKVQLVDGEDVQEFVAILKEIEDAMQFFGRECGGAEAFGRSRSNTNATAAANHARKRGGAREHHYDASASGSAEYYRRACALQDAALELLRVGVADRILQTSTQVQDALNLPKIPLSADKLEASLAYTRFHGISKRSNVLISIARRRLEALGDNHGGVISSSSSSVAACAYEDLLALCRNTYCGAREVLLTTTVRSHMDILKERHGLVGMTRLASVFLIRLCTIETALYLDFFGDPDKRRHPRKRTKGALQHSSSEEDIEEDGEDPTNNDQEEQKGNGITEPPSPQQQQQQQQQQQHNNKSSSHPAAATLASQILSEDSSYRDAEFQSMLGALCSALHRTIRRGLVSVLDLDVLCQVVSVLREERSVANSSPTTLAAARAVSGVIQDAQERLIFCANTALHKEVVRFKPTLADLNYPGKLLGEKPKSAIVIEDGGGEGVGENIDESKGAAIANEAKAAAISDPNDAVAAQLRVYESWFPPMRSVLRILSKIFRVVEPRVFEDIALQSVQSCTKCLKDGSIHILSKSGQIHADLFLVKHLLILREQLSPFDIQLRSVERQLDFSEAGKAVSRFLANRNRRLFSMSTENALITLLREGVSVQESSVDSKRDLEDCLRSACNDFIEHTLSSLLGPIAVFVDQCKNTVGSAAGSADALIKAPFINASLVHGVFSKAFENLDGELDNVSKQMNLYLENTATQGILLKPVVRKMTRSLEEAKRFIAEVPDGENGWDEELKEEVLKISEAFETKVKAASSKQGR